ncbi:MAG: four helix bundle protein [Bacillota bacterium]
MSSTSYKELEVWNKAKDLAVQIYKLTNQGEFAKDYSLKDQIRRSAVSIPSNIAEGNDRESEKEYARFLYIAKGSLSELQTQLVISKEIGYIDEETFKVVDSECNSIGKMLGKFIKTLCKSRE